MDPLSKAVVASYFLGLGWLNLWAGSLARAQDAVTTVVTTPTGTGGAGDDGLGSLIHMVQNMGWPGAVVVVSILVLRRDKLPTFPIRISHYHYDEGDEPTNHGRHAIKSDNDD